MWWLVAAVVFLGAAAVRWWLFGIGRPQVSGTIQAPGLGAPVQVVRDRWGVPHITAQSRDDALFALGFVHAQERLWQMELQRRVALGRLSEMFGPVTLPVDRFMRRLGLHRAAAAEAAQLDPEEQAALEAYCRGVNACVARAGGRLPLELRLLGIRPAPWTAADSLAWAKMMALGLTMNWEQELLRYQLVQKVGAAAAARFDFPYQPGLPLTTLPAGEGAGDAAADLLRLYQAAQPYLSLGAVPASNNWVVAGHRTDTGKPLLANDPHLQLQVPGVWYQAHLAWPDGQVTGVSLPGIPGVVIGHNGHVGWGITAGMADQADLFLEKWHPTEAACEYQGNWEPARVVREVIRVKGKPDEVETVYITRHGPVLAGGPLGPGPALALRADFLDPGHPVRVVLRQGAARTAAEFRQALRDWAVANMNFVFADTAGNIGYLLAGRLPIRQHGTGLTPVPGWSGEYEWQGCVPFDQQPQLWNPPAGFIVTANNATTGGSYPYHISWDFLNGYRAQRLQDLLRSAPVVTAAHCRQMQLDVYSLPGREFAAHCRGLQPVAPLEQQALRALLDWDGHLTAHSTGGAVYQVMLWHALRLAYRDLLGPELLDFWLGKGEGLAPVRMHASRVTSTLLRDLDAGRVGPDVLAASLAAAVQYLRGRLGNDPARWQWGNLHRLRPTHPLAAQKPLHLIFNGPEVPLGGDFDTPCQVGFLPQEPFTAGCMVPSYRQVLDFADLSRSVAVIPGGQSGHPGSRHYMDLFRLWHRGEYHPMLWAPDAIRQHAEATLRLEPGAGGGGWRRPTGGPGGPPGPGRGHGGHGPGRRRGGQATACRRED